MRFTFCLAVHIYGYSNNSGKFLRWQGWRGYYWKLCSDTRGGWTRASEIPKNKSVFLGCQCTDLTIKQWASLICYVTSLVMLYASNHYFLISPWIANTFTKQSTLLWCLHEVWLEYPVNPTEPHGFFRNVYCPIESHVSYPTKEFK